MGRIASLVRLLRSQKRSNHPDAAPRRSNGYPSNPPKSRTRPLVRHVPPIGPVTPHPGHSFTQLPALRGQDPPGSHPPTHPPLRRRRDGFLLRQPPHDRRQSHDFAVRHHVRILRRRRKRNLHRVDRTLPQETRNEQHAAPTQPGARQRGITPLHHPLDRDPADGFVCAGLNMGSYLDGGCPIFIYNSKSYLGNYLLTCLTNYRAAFSPVWSISPASISSMPQGRSAVPSSGN